MSEGYSFRSFGAVVGVSRKTLYEWVDKYPEFAEAKDIATSKAQMFFEKRLNWKLSGDQKIVQKSKNVDVSCLIFALKTRFSKDYSDKQIVEQTNINMSVPDKEDLEL